jgi:spore germination cell wall hydrolase CwlJ-like protein
MALYGSQDIEIVARTVYGEARSGPWRGKLAVAFVILNRAKARHTAPAREARRPWQFSCWNADDPNRKGLLVVDPSNKSFRECVAAAAVALADMADDPTKGSLHYHTRAVKPFWSEGKTPCVEIGAHLFYNDVAL